MDSFHAFYKALGISIAWLEGLGSGWSLRRGGCFGLDLTCGVLGHLAFELAAALDFDFGVIQVARHTATAVDENMVVANNVFSQNTMYINDLRVDLACHAALGPNLQVSNADLTCDGSIDAGAAWR